MIISFLWRRRAKAPLAEDYTECIGVLKIKENVKSQPLVEKECRRDVGCYIRRVVGDDRQPAGVITMQVLFALFLLGALVTYDVVATQVSTGWSMVINQGTHGTLRPGLSRHPAMPPVVPSRQATPPRHIVMPPRHATPSMRISH